MWITRRQALDAGLAVAAAGVGIDGFFIEPRWLEVTRHSITVPGLPRALEGYTIVQLTDAHMKACLSPERQR